MIKRLIKKVFYFIYKVGYFESVKIEKDIREKRLSEIAIIEENVWISNNAIIINNSHPRHNIRIGKNSRFMGNMLLFDACGKIEIGEDCFIGPDTRIWSAKNISIGSRVLIAHNVNIHDNISHPIDADIRHQEYMNFVETGIHDQTDLKGRDIVIEDDVWIGFNATILRGVRIGKGAIIGACSLVTKDVEPWTINVGNPLQCIKKMNPIEVNHDTKN